jgi:predicted glutamine amidotransferase
MRHRIRHRDSSGLPGMRAGLLAAVALLAQLALFPPLPASACRLWALVGDGYPQTLIADHLRDGTISNLRHLGIQNDDGWGFSYFVRDPSPLPLNRPILRKGGTTAITPWLAEYPSAVDEMSLVRPKAALGHVRACNWSNSHCGIPDPHPFQRELLIFAHNGHMADTVMVDLLTRDDGNYLANHPPDHYRPYIDSELYFLYLLKYIHAHIYLTRTEALRRAVGEVAYASPDSRLNFTLTDGDTLYAVRRAVDDTLDPMQYYPAGGGSSPYWVVASQVVGSTTEGWAEFPLDYLGVFAPGRAPVFYPITDPTLDAPDDPVGSGGGSGGGAANVRLLAGPNPMSASIAIPLRGAGGRVSVEIFDAQGRRVWRTARACRAGGDEVIWDGRDLSERPVPSGTYYCRITQGTGATVAGVAKAGTTTRTETISVVR